MQLFLEALDQVARILLGSDLSSVPSHSSATYVDPNVLWDHCCHLSEVGSSLILLLGLPPELYPCGSSPPAHPSGSEKSTYLQAEHGICVSSELCLYPELPASTRCYCPVAHWRCQNHLCFLPLCPPSRTPVRLPGLFYFPSKCLLASSLLHILIPPMASLWDHFSVIRGLASHLPSNVFSCCQNALP